MVRFCDSTSAHYDCRSGVASHSILDLEKATAHKWPTFRLFALRRNLAIALHNLRLPAQYSHDISCDTRRTPTRRHTEPSFACGSRVRWSLTLGQRNESNRANDSDLDYRGGSSWSRLLDRNHPRPSLSHVGQLGCVAKHDESGYAVDAIGPD